MPFGGNLPTCGRVRMEVFIFTILRSKYRGLTTAIVPPFFIVGASPLIYAKIRRVLIPVTGLKMTFAQLFTIETLILKKHPRRLKRG